MNILLAELLNSVPPEFSVKNQAEDSIRFRHKNKEIYITWFGNGQPLAINYSEKGICHRPISEGPAIQSWYDNGQPFIISYIENGQNHRPISEGPTYQEWNKDGSLDSEQYWENGKEIKVLTKNK